MGPIIVQVGKRADGLVFGLHPLSRAMIQSAFPTANTNVKTVDFSFETSRDFRFTLGGLEDFAREVVPRLTGLSLGDLETVGYALIEDDTGQTLVFKKPGDLSHVHS